MFKTLRSKIISGFTVMMAITTLISAWSISNFSYLGSSVGKIINENYYSVLASEEMVVALEQQNSALILLLSGEWEPGEKLLEENRLKFNSAYLKGIAGIALSEEPTILKSINLTYNNFQMESEKFKTILLTQGRDQAQIFFFSNLQSHYEQIKSRCFRLLDVNQKAMFYSDIITREQSRNATLAMTIVALVGLAFSITFSLWLSNYIIRPAQKLTATVKQITAGNLDQHIVIDTEDEIGELGREFNRMTGRLRHYETLNIDHIISEQKKSETIVRTIAEAIIVTDDEHRVIMFNQVASNLLEISREAAFMRPIDEVIHIVELADLIKKASQQKNEDLSSQAENLPILNIQKKTKDFYYRIIRSPMKSEIGKFLGVVTVLQDVTPFKELDRLKSDFMASVSHEFRTPLTSIGMGLDILNEQLIGPLNEEQKKLIGSARLDSQRLSKLIRELLELARLESGYYPFKHDRLNIAQLVESVLQPLQLPAEEKKVAIKTFVQEQLPIYDGDSQQLSWVITNLMNNALRSSSAGGEVTLEAFGKGPYLIFRVSDHGNGIPPDQLASIFDKFVQIENNGVNSRGSVGLGLAIVKEIVNHYSGKIDVKSELGQGSMFTVSLPLPSFEPREEKNA